MSSVVTVHGTGLSGPSVTATVQMANNVSFAMAKENFLNDNVTVEEARDSENVLVISGSRTAVTDQVESWNGKGLVDGFDISGGGGGGGATVKNASVGVHEGNIPQDRDYRIVVSGEIREVPDNGTRIGPSTVSGVSRAPGLRSIFTYTGEITSFEADRKVSIKQDGEIIREGTQEPPPDPDPTPGPGDPDPDPPEDPPDPNPPGQPTPPGPIDPPPPQPAPTPPRPGPGPGDPTQPDPDPDPGESQAGIGASTIALIGAAGIGAYLIGQNS
jgi:hypothetical protein